MNRSEQINELAAALAMAQGQMEGAKKDSDNPFFKSKYADLASVVDAIRGPLAEHGLAYVQLPIPTERDEVQVETVLLHASGQWIASIVTVPVTKQDAQGYGSALTYARRYGLQAMAGVAAEDDDGNAAAKAKPRPTEQEMMPRASKAPVEVKAAPTEAPPVIGTVDPDTGEVGPPRTLKFMLNKSNYETAGMTAGQLFASFGLVAQVDKRMGKNYARDMLKTEFGVISRSDLTEEAAERFLIRLKEVIGD